MAWYNRKMVVVIKDKMAICLNCSPERCPKECGMRQFLSPPSSPIRSENHHMPYFFVILLCVLGAVFVFICYMITLRRYNMNTRRSNENLSGNGEGFVDENNGTDMDHPIWYIHTIGLPQSVIESIPEFKYKKIDSLIDGVDCSVCLCEFEEDESLRLLPKCSHAFHVTCIDTWLSSHMNCPVCRAPIVSDLNAALGINNVEVSSTDVNGSSGNEVNPVENERTGSEMENQELDEGENREMSVRDENVVALSNEEGKIVGILEKVHGVVDEKGKGKGLRVSSDLAEHRVKVNNVMQTALRSVSMDPSAVLVVRRAMSQMSLGNSGEGCSNSKDQLAEGKAENSDAAAKRGNRNSRLYEAMKCSSFGRSLQKVPICMKRSFSSSGIHK
ncbi:RING-H2 finger protein ATL51-like [Solanum dulcamara]|uniref:RING-H2 finger protein ATL51-like n=1 Tax=Solanum dulcamara TaxID=45834 RepID=UPI0024851131|nr:RING-H2 finger protein ATL51-like [Solanum dulcamara]